MSYKIFGEGKVNLIIEMGLGATGGEWWHIAEHLAGEYTVLLYERSKNVKIERTPKNIACELCDLLKRIPHEEKLIILAHSQGGLYAQQFIRLYPQMIKGVILIDPLSANDNYYKEVLTPKEQKQSGFNKTGNLVIMKHIASLHLGCGIKLIMRKAPPFYYYPQEYLSFSAVTQFIQAKNSGHFIHLTEPELIDQSLSLIKKNIIK